MAINVDEAALDAFLADPATPGGDMNPAGTAAAPAAAAAPVAQADVQVEIPSTPATEAVAAAPAVDENQWDEKTQKYIKDLRTENATYRNRSKRVNEVFDGSDPEALDAWLDLATTLRDDPKAAAERFAEVADALRAQYADPNGAAADAAVDAAGLAPAEAAAEADRPLTRRELESIFAEREEKADLARRVAKIEVDAVALGYTASPDDESYQELLYVASKIPSGNIAEAHAKLEARNQAVVDRYLASVNGASAPRVPVNGAPQSGEVKLKTFDEANAALDAYLSGLA